jgi:hypothetical protein
MLKLLWRRLVTGVSRLRLHPRVDRGPNSNVYVTRNGQNVLTVDLVRYDGERTVAEVAEIMANLKLPTVPD